MERGTRSLILGIAIGAVAATLVLRLRQLIEAQNPETVVEQLADDMEALEERLHLKS